MIIFGGNIASSTNKSEVPTITASFTPLIQMKCEACEEESFVHTKLIRRQQDIAGY